VWELFLPEVRPGELYKFEIVGRDTRELKLKSDPYGAAFEQRPATASVVATPSAFEWSDGDWMRRRTERDWLREPISIYEVHVGSWRRGPAGQFMNYRELGRELAAYASDLGFTHVELLPITEHPHDDSWGYQCTGFFAPTRRHGEPDDLRALIAADARPHDNRNTRYELDQRESRFGHLAPQGAASTHPHDSRAAPGCVPCSTDGRAELFANRYPGPAGRFLPCRRHERLRAGLRRLYSARGPRAAGGLAQWRPYTSPALARRRLRLGEGA
jgi:hypothetical protein